jgi:hypothetical protein
LRDAIGASARRLLRRDGASARREIWSLRDINLEVPRARRWG